MELSYSDLLEICLLSRNEVMNWDKKPIPQIWKLICPPFQNTAFMLNY